ncbi:hypothetical protein PAHAL_4G228800 [Panicum hallii]|jgi:hypothetical protein|uniref:Uncharacterized protein n=1 Tax=Panicum hallii TaxID=206008 RepID=A0A2T8IA52_9POAL|nr:hypothetical protein PAHAL_8G246600 [Panicum hallii]PVH48054.1 hypothetical protein PAHAL_4G228800 [Panicum hallii]
MGKEAVDEYGIDLHGRDKDEWMMEEETGLLGAGELTPLSHAPVSVELDGPRPHAAVRLSAPHAAAGQASAGREEKDWGRFLRSVTSPLAKIWLLYQMYK